ncbi:S-layer homology domain-containing protein [Paenibacillus soyae]|uniref:S-layer homology domain-containing protein n=1 Tax=Paenibacillus soyae TaxID=2969249 RepID=A0A9X2MU43_9BACL|nr:S-layer homology domain-containing protein [Paenibacillus soyae]MCR2807056.1 S-layer homology domain-containing protein [Paenibacillus soyae]
MNNRLWKRAQSLTARMLVALMAATAFAVGPAQAGAEEESVSIALGAAVMPDGMTARAGDNPDGLKTGSIAGRDYWQTDKSAGTYYFYMNVDDGYLMDNTEYNVDVTVDYYDSGNGKIVLQYDAASANFKDGPLYQYGNTGEWKSHTFSLTDAQFANGTNGADFRLGIEGAGSPAAENAELTAAKVTVKKTPKSVPTETVGITLGTAPVENGITGRPGDGPPEGMVTGELDGKGFWRTNQTVNPADPGQNILYYYFNVSDSYLFENEDQDVYVTVEYYDSGSGAIVLQYDARSAGFKDATLFRYKDTNTWKTHTFKLTDAYFGNRTHGGDFRLGVSGAGAPANNPELQLASVTVRKQTQVIVESETQVYDTVYATGDVVIADVSVKDYGAVGDGAADDTMAFQNALAAAGNNGGGVVFAPAGAYKLTGELVIPTGVTLRGDWANPEAEGGAVKGTILAVYGGRGQGEGTSFIQLQPSSGVTNLSIWYPEQTVSSPAVYPWTLEQLPGDSATIKNVTLVNSYKGIKIGPEWNELHYVRNLYGTTLHTGIFLDFTTDIGRLEGIRLSPEVWANSGLPGAPSESELFGYMTANAEGIVMGRSDWEYMSDIEIAGYKTGMRVTTRTGSLETANAQLYGIRIRDCNVALKIEGVNDFGLLVTDSRFEAGVGPNPTAIYATSGFRSIAQFSGVTVGGTTHHAVVNEGSGVLSFENSVFGGWDDEAGGYAIAAKSGSLILGGTEFAKPDRHLLLEGSVSTVNAINSGFEGELAVQNDSEAAVLNVHQDARYELERLPEIGALDLAEQPKPATRQLFNVGAEPYNADRTGVIDASDAIGQALADAEAAGGGTVYMPAGVYRVEQPFTVPSGVELRGNYDVPHHTIGNGTVIFTSYGENDPDGEAFIRLEQDAGLRGLSVYYDKQDWSSAGAIKPYAWTVQGLGSGVYLIDTTLVNSYKAVDFGTHDTSGHYIDYVAGSPLMEGIFLGGGADGGIMRNVQFNPHYYGRNNYPNAPTTGQGFEVVWGYQKENLDAFRIGDVSNQTIFNTFVYGSKYGIHFEEQNGRGPEAIVLGHGTDGSKKGAVLHGAGPAGLTFINTELVSMSTTDKVYVEVNEAFGSKATFFNTSMWGDTTRSMDIYGGDVRIQQSNFTRVGDIGVNALGGDVTLYNSYFQQPRTTHVYAGPAIEKMVVTNNLFNGGIVVENEAISKVTGTNLVPVALELLKGEFNPEEPEDTRTELRLTNVTESEPLEGKLELVQPAVYANALKPVRFEGIALGESVNIPLPYLTGDSLMFKVTLKSGYTYTASVKLGQSFAAREDAAGTVVPAIDVSSQDHYSSVGGSWGGAEDLSADSMVTWDEEKLYVNVEVTDNVHHQTWTNGDIWQGDSLQVGIDMARADGAASKHVNELGLALNGQDVVTAWRWRAPEGVAAGALNGVTADITRNEAEKRTVYELAIPFMVLHGAGYTFDAGEPLGLTLLVNENDGSGRSGFIEYNQGIGTSKDATLFGDLHLLSADYAGLLLASAEAAVEEAETDRSKTSRDAAANFVVLLPEGSSKQALEMRLEALEPNPGTGPGNGSDNGSGNGGVPAGPAGLTLQADGSVLATLTARLDGASKQAKAAVTASAAAQAIGLAKAGADGGKQVTFDIPAVQGAEGYSLELPAGLLTEDHGRNVIEIRTALGMLSVSGDMLVNLADKLGETVTFVLADADRSGWSEELRSRIGDRPAVDLHILSGNDVVEWSNGQSPVTVSLPYEPSGKEIGDEERVVVWHIDENGMATAVPSGRFTEGKVVFRTTHFSAFAVVHHPKSFQDLSGFGWARQAIETLAAKGIASGVTDQSYRPGSPVKRADFLKLLVGTLGLEANPSAAVEPFADVPAGAYYAEAVSIARALGITNGAGGNRFLPDTTITREEAAVMIERALRAADISLPQGEASDFEPYKDGASVSAFAEEAVRLLSRAGLVEGANGAFKPQGHLTRAETAVLLYRLYNL